MKKIGTIRAVVELDLMEGDTITEAGDWFVYEEPTVTDRGALVSARRPVRLISQETVKEHKDMRDIVRDATSEIERELITKALNECDGNETNTARKLKISRSTLKKKREELGV